ncbi:MAG: family N-acetyltransferase [Friedmanniella sp.]|nr:family N-acetyltransferase [Friedmanniella sp.]
MTAPVAEWHVARPLVGDHLRLTALRLSDAPDFLAALGDPDDAAAVLAHLNYRIAPGDLAAVRSRIALMLANPDQVAYAQRRPDGELVGTTSFYEISPATRSLAIGHTWVGRRWWRTGVNTEAKLLMMTRAFDGLGAERLVWHTDIRNERSQAAIARLGATREGVLRHHRIRVDGSWRDTVQFAMLAGEWPQARDRLRSALADSTREH